MTARRFAFLALLFLFLTFPAVAQDADFYKRTGTHPHPPAAVGDFFLPLSARIMDNMGIGLGLGWQDRKTGFIVMGELTYDRIDGVSGTTSFTRNCRTYAVPFSTSERNVTGVTLTLGIPLRKAVRYAGH